MKSKLVTTLDDFKQLEEQRVAWKVVELELKEENQLPKQLADRKDAMESQDNTAPVTSGESSAEALAVIDVFAYKTHLSRTVVFAHFTTQAKICKLQSRTLKKSVTKVNVGWVLHLE